jgi:NAD dependent epimerase/dehydratase family enzyme
MGAQMAEELLLSGQQVMPTRLEQTGFVFNYPELAAALRHVLGR